MLVMFISVDLYTPFCIHIPLNINCHSVTLFSISCFFVLFTIVEDAQCRSPWFESAEFVAFGFVVALAFVCVFSLWWVCFVGVLGGGGGVAQVLGRHLLHAHMGLGPTLEFSCMHH